jgi:carbon-monoxide dehydrogenase large subunit
VQQAIEWGKKPSSNDPTKVIGQGFSLFWKAPAMPPNASSSAFLKFNEDATINLIISGMDIGQGYQTVMAQIAAEILSVPPHKIRVETPDTDRNPYEWQTVASHITWSSGNAVKKAALDAKEQILSLVHRVFHYPIDELFLEDEAVKCQTDPALILPLKDFVVDGIMTKDGTFKGGPHQRSRDVYAGIFQHQWRSRNQSRWPSECALHCRCGSLESGN